MNPTEKLVSSVVPYREHAAIDLLQDFISYQILFCGALQPQQKAPMDIHVEQTDRALP